MVIALAQRALRAYGTQCSEAISSRPGLLRFARNDENTLPLRKSCLGLVSESLGLVSESLGLVSESLGLINESLRLIDECSLPCSQSKRAKTPEFLFVGIFTNSDF
ncbi:MAG: hypothetical protein HC862_28190 [Scytonema sp. RU_4_4]|nr:hypothetical protein [Scytonema sp. RU_4_4]